jgi:hypothetical protein
MQYAFIPRWRLAFRNLGTYVSYEEEDTYCHMRRRIHMLEARLPKPWGVTYTKGEQENEVSRTGRLCRENTFYREHIL